MHTQSCHQHQLDNYAVKDSDDVDRLTKATTLTMIHRWKGRAGSQDSNVGHFLHSKYTSTQFVFTGNQPRMSAQGKTRTAPNTETTVPMEAYKNVYCIAGNTASMCISRSFVQCCFTFRETVETIRNVEPRTATSTFTQPLNSV